MKKTILAVIVSVMLLSPSITMAWSYEDLPDKPPTYEELVEKVVEHTIDEMHDEIDMLAQLVYTEARGVKSKAEQAAVIWCVLNRVDSDKYPNTIQDVVKQKHQFAYRKFAPVCTQYQQLSKDVLMRWMREKYGIEDIGRTLPRTYLFFAGRGGRNWFRIVFKGSRHRWGWMLPDPYREEKE